MPTKHPNECCTADQVSCGAIVTERNRYFTGKYMSARDFQADQDYFLSHHRLHHRLFHGWGIVCGLEVIPHKDPACKDRWVIVCPGVAIDCCGRELVLDTKTPVKIWEPPAPPDEDDEEAESETTALMPISGASQYGKPDDDDEDDENGEEEQRFLLYLRYVEEKVEYVPALYAEGECDPTRQEANRLREVARLEVVRWEDIENSGWRVPEGDPETYCRDDCADPVPGPSGICLEPDCPTHHMVPLALIQPRQTPAGGYIIDDLAIDTKGQRQLPLPADYLTHIVHINWPHGGEVTLDHLAGASEAGGMGKRLEIRFDRKLLAANAPGMGVTPYTFVVQYGGIQQDIEYLHYDNSYPPTLEDDCVAVFTIDPDYFRQRSNIAGNTVLVTLKCNFILDCHNNPVDGDYLRGRLPSGDGTPGGTFESWFYVR